MVIIILYKLLKENFLLKMKSKYNLYKYEENKLISYKDITTLYKNENVEEICQ